MVAPDPHDAAAAVPGRPFSEPGHVAGTLCHRDYQSAARFCPLELANVFSDAVGLGDVVRQHRFVSHAAVPVHPLSAGHFDFGSAGAARGTERRQIVKGKEQLHGLMAEFEEHEELLKATRKAYAEGYRRMDAYSPFPVEGLAEALGRRGTLVPLIVLLGGITGGLGGFLMQDYSTKFYLLQHSK